VAEKKTKKIALEKAMSWAGINYAPGINTMPEDAAKYAIKRNFGRGADEAAAAEDEAFTPLSIEETMERFSNGDSSDEVFKSLKFHQQTIVKSRGPLKEDGGTGEQQNDGGTSGQSATGGKTDEDLKAESDAKAKADADAKTESEKGSPGGNAAKGLPDSFPMKHVFEKLGLTSVEEIQSMSKEDLVKLDGIADASAEKVLAFGK